MTDEEFRKLRRSDLLELLLAQSEEIEQLKEQLSNAEEELADRKLVMENAGSIAEAALQLNGIFEAAQKAADQYVESVKAQAEKTAEADCETKEDTIEAASAVIEKAAEGPEEHKSETESMEEEPAEEALREKIKEELRQEMEDWSSQMIADTRERCDQIKAKTYKECQALLEKAKAGENIED